MISTKHILIGVLACVSLLVPVRATALSPGPDVYNCWNEKQNGFLTSRCEQVLCEWENIERNWPTGTGYHRDCTASWQAWIVDNVVYVIPVAALLIIGILWLVVWLSLRHKKNKPREKQ